MKRLLCLLGAILVCGCGTSRFVVDSQRVQQYLTAHPDRPADVRSALATGTVVKGMTRDEVAICWGKADRVTIEEKDSIMTETWVYLQTQIAGKTHRTTYYQDKPVKGAKFQKGLVVGWKIWSSD